MDRIIKFRGKEFPNNNWIFASAYDQDNEIFIIDFANFAVIAETVGQFTGFKDVDGNEIFEGDILEYPGNFGACVVVTDIREFVYRDIASQFKVIGNIHDTPELLEGDSKTQEVNKTSSDNPAIFAEDFEDDDDLPSYI